MLQAALNIEGGIDGLRYNNVVIATDADVDGMHIRLLLLTFFLQFFPDLIKKGHVYVLQTPLFRVRNRRPTPLCRKSATIHITVIPMKSVSTPSTALGTTPR